MNDVEEFYVSGDVVRWSRRQARVTEICARKFDDWVAVGMYRIIAFDGGWALYAGGDRIGTMPREVVRGWNTRAPKIEWEVWIAAAV